MDSFWLDPPGPNSPAARSRVWDAIVAYTQPSARRVVRPLQRARIIAPTVGGTDIVPAVWGLVPAWAASGERRPVALRHALLDVLMAPDSSVTGDIWGAVRPVRRCLVPASGWIASHIGGHLVLKPETAPVTLAGLSNIIHADGGEPVCTFGVLYCVINHAPYDGTKVPIVIRAQDRNRWLTCAPTAARGYLRPPGMKVHVQRAPNSREHDQALYGADYSETP
jgi:putative SOS response-associated peptidase YedK